MKVILAVALFLFGIFFTLNYAFAAPYTLPSGKVIDIESHGSKKEFRFFTLPSGVLFLAEQLVPITKAAELSVREEIILHIRQKAQEYELKEVIFVATIKCESNFNQNARGKAGEIGIAQFMPSTWKMFKSDFGDSDMSIHSWEDQVELMARAWDKGLHKHWSCWRIVTKK